MPEAAMEEEGDSVVLRKMKPKILDHNDAHPVAENMKIRKDSGLRLWRESDPYATRRRTVVDYMFHTKEQQDFYETVLLDKKPIVCDMRWVDWKYIRENEEHYPGVYDSFKSCGVEEFVGQKLMMSLLCSSTPQPISTQMEGLSGCLKVLGTSQQLQNGLS